MGRSRVHRGRPLPGEAEGRHRPVDPFAARVLECTGVLGGARSALWNEQRDSG